MRKDIALVALIVASLALMVIPLSPAIIDVLLALNISLTVLLLMVAVYLKHPSDFSTFPSVILIGTAFRLALSIGTTRLILSEADAGDIITTFGEFVVSGSIAIGLVVFLIITVVQFVVVTKGAERVAEVGARFALDALPGKQMSIDAELRAGGISADEAAVLRRRLDRDSRFFGAMDGAMKFIKGDAIAGLIIIFINLIGGVAVGISVHSYSFGEAVSIYSLLTIGDGLVAQLPALLMSLCAGIIVTRADGQEGQDLGTDITAELIADPRVPAIGAPIVFGIGLIPGFPTLTFSALAGAMLVISLALRAKIALAEKARVEEAGAQASEESALEEALTQTEPSNRIRFKIATDLRAELDVDAISAHLVSHVNLLHMVGGARFSVPSLSFSDTIEPRSFVVEIDEVPVFRDKVPQNAFLVTAKDALDLPTSRENPDLAAWSLIDGRWLPAVREPDLARYEVEKTPLEDALACVAFRIYEQNLGELFSDAVLDDLLQAARDAEPALMEKIEGNVDRNILQKTFRYLIEDGVPLRPLPLLVSALNDWSTTVDDLTPIALAEGLRSSLKRQLCHRIAGENGVLGLALLGPDLEAEARKGVAESKRMGMEATSQSLVLKQDIADRLITSVRRLSERKSTGGRQVALLVTADLRRQVRNFLASNNTHIPVLAPHEIAIEISTYPIKLIETAPRAKRASLPNSAIRKGDRTDSAQTIAAE